MKHFRLILTAVAVAVFSGALLPSCSEGEAPAPAGALTLAPSETGAPYLVIVGETLGIPYTAEQVGTLTCSAAEGWTVELDETARLVKLSASLDTNAEPSITLTLSGVDMSGKTLTSSVEVHLLDFSDPKGAFVLNEGNMTTENGSLTYISPWGDVVPDAYRLANGTELGNVCQDLYIHDGLVYILSQNGGKNTVGSEFENDGMLVVADARTLKRVKAFSSEELSALSWPTHLAVLDAKHVYIRTDSDNGGATQQGIWRLDTTSGALFFVEKTAGAPKNRMAVVGGKVYSTNGSYMVNILQISADSDIAEKIALPFSSQILHVNDSEEFAGGIRPSDDGGLWIMGQGTGRYWIHKYDLSARAGREMALAAEPRKVYNCPFAVDGNVIYYVSGTSVHRFDFDAASTAEADLQLFDVYDFDALAGNTLYNGPGFHPVTGDLYVASMGDFTNYATDNVVWVVSPAAPTQPVAQYRGYAHFPAGIYFPAEF